MAPERLADAVEVDDEELFVAIMVLNGPVVLENGELLLLMIVDDLLSNVELLMTLEEVLVLKSVLVVVIETEELDVVLVEGPIGKTSEGLVDSPELEVLAEIDKNVPPDLELEDQVVEIRVVIGHPSAVEG